MSTPKFDLRTSLLVFVTMVFMEALSAAWVVSVAERNILQAASVSAILEFCKVFVVLSYVKNIRVVLPIVTGSFVGTWIAMSFL